LPMLSAHDGCRNRQAASNINDVNNTFFIYIPQRYNTPPTA
jgi:hypothetical protein